MGSSRTFRARLRRTSVLLVVLILAGSASAGARVPGPRTGRARATGGGASTGASPPARLLPGAARPGAVPVVVRHGPRTGNRVALTFDSNMTDGMLADLDSGRVDSYANVKVIDILEQRQVPATFFLAGQWVLRYPGLTSRLAADPRFELASHSYRHEAFTPSCYHLAPLAADLMAEDVRRSFEILAPYGGRQTRYFRFPGGCYDATALAALAPLGVTVIQWDVVSGDAFGTAPEPIVRAVLGSVQPGSIVVMHITEGNARFTDDALPAILDGLQARHLEPVMLSDLLSGRAGRAG